MSLSSYILAGYFKNERKSTEAAMKYFILGAVSSAILLYGISLIYGVCGSLNLLDVAAAMSTIVTNDALMFGIMLLGAGLCFKIAAVPFHVWTPDVYEGAPTPITAFLSTGSKAAAFAIFARIFYVGLHDFQLDWSNVLATIAALSMILGNLAAITQDNVKRMLGVLVDRARRLRAARRHRAQRASACAASSSTPSSTSSRTSASGRPC